MKSRFGLALVAAAVLVFPTGAHATFPGANGKIAYVRANQIWTMNPDGSGQTQVTNEVNGAAQPSWSPDGSKIAYRSNPSPFSGTLFIINADGSGRTPLPTFGDPDSANEPSWSPDGAQLLYVRKYERQVPESDTYPAGELRRINADGTGDTFIDDGTLGISNPRWSPDGTKIAYTWDTDYAGTPNIRVRGVWQTITDDDVFLDWRPDGARILGLTLLGIHDPAGHYTVKASDGTDKTYIPTEIPAEVWSPDGSKLIGTASGEITTWNTDGSSPTNLTNTPGPAFESEPDWAPIPITAYARPKGASPMQVFLVPASAPCAAPNRTHGAPLAFPSCSPPSQASAHLTVGTPDANGAGAKSIAKVFYKTLVGVESTPADEADVAVTVTISDVRNSDLSDYGGTLRLVSDLSITDKDNTPSPSGPSAGTAQTAPLPITIQCVPTADATVGSNCNVQTTVEALFPGAVKEGRRAVWQLDQLRAYDGGPDGNAATNDGNTLFLTQGIFIP